MAEGHVCGQYTTYEWGEGSGGVFPRKFFKFETRKCYFLHSDIPKNKNIINNNLSLLSGGEINVTI